MLKSKYRCRVGNNSVSLLLRVEVSVCTVLPLNYRTKNQALELFFY